MGEFDALGGGGRKRRESWLREFDALREGGAGGQESAGAGGTEEICISNN